MPPTDPCPDADALHAFAAGSLPTARVEEIADHLDRCGVCRVRLEAFDRETGPIVDALRRDPVPLPSAAPTTNADERPRIGDGPEEEVRRLLRRRLLVVGVVAAATGFGLAFATSVGSDDSVTAASSSGGGMILLAAYALFSTTATLLVRRRPEMSLRSLRRIELAHVAWCVAFSSLFRWTSLKAGAGLVFANDDHRRLYVEQAALLGNLSWYMLILGYGLLIPNPPRRAAWVVGGVAAAALGSLVLSGLYLDYMRDRLAMLSGVTGIGVFMTFCFAVFGSYRISSLEAQVFEAKRIGPYSLIRKLGAGGMGEVHLAEHRLLKRPCAVKLIRPDKAPDSATLRRFEREARATARLSHPNTVEVFDFGRTEAGTFYYVMEYLDGPTLAQLVESEGPLPPARAVHFLLQLCGALREAHAAGLVHRDIKPGNVMVCTIGGTPDVAKLLDFGLVRPTGEDDGLTSEGIAVGTPEFMSPEQASSGPVDGRSDVYSLGALAHYLVSGRPPFRGGSVLETLIAHRRQPPTPLRELDPDVPADFEAVVLRCLEKAPGRRFPSISALRDALAAVGPVHKSTATESDP